MLILLRKNESKGCREDKAFKKECLIAAHHANTLTCFLTEFTYSYNVRYHIMCCWVRNYHGLNRLKQHKFIIALFLGVACLCPLLQDLKSPLTCLLGLEFWLFWGMICLQTHLWLSKLFFACCWLLRGQL